MDMKGDVDRIAEDLVRTKLNTGARLPNRTRLIARARGHVQGGGCSGCSDERTVAIWYVPR